MEQLVNLFSLSRIDQENSDAIVKNKSDISTMHRGNLSNVSPSNRENNSISNITGSHTEDFNLSDEGDHKVGQSIAHENSSGEKDAKQSAPNNTAADSFKVTASNNIFNEISDIIRPPAANIDNSELCDSNRSKTEISINRGDNNQVTNSTNLRYTRLSLCNKQNTRELYKLVSVSDVLSAGFEISTTLNRLLSIDFQANDDFIFDEYIKDYFGKEANTVNIDADLLCKVFLVFLKIKGMEEKILAEVEKFDEFLSSLSDTGTQPDYGDFKHENTDLLTFKCVKEILKSINPIVFNMKSYVKQHIQKSHEKSIDFDGHVGNCNFVLENTEEIKGSTHVVNLIPHSSYFVYKLAQRENTFDGSDTSVLAYLVCTDYSFFYCGDNPVYYILDLILKGQSQCSASNSQLESHDMILESKCAAHLISKRSVDITKNNTYENRSAPMDHISQRYKNIEETKDYQIYLHSNENESEDDSLSPSPSLLTCESPKDLSPCENTETSQRVHIKSSNKNLGENIHKKENKKSRSVVSSLCCVSEAGELDSSENSYGSAYKQQETTSKTVMKTSLNAISSRTKKDCFHRTTINQSNTNSKSFSEYTVNAVTLSKGKILYTYFTHCFSSKENKSIEQIIDDYEIFLQKVYKADKNQHRLIHNSKLYSNELYFVYKLCSLSEFYYLEKILKHLGSHLIFYLKLDFILAGLDVQPKEESTGYVSYIKKFLSKASTGLKRLIVKEKVNAHNYDSNASEECHTKVNSEAERSEFCNSIANDIKNHKSQRDNHLYQENDQSLNQVSISSKVSDKDSNTIDSDRTVTYENNFLASAHKTFSKLKDGLRVADSTSTQSIDDYFIEIVELLIESSPGSQSVYTDAILLSLNNERITKEYILRTNIPVNSILNTCKKVDGALVDCFNICFDQLFVENETIIE